MNKENVREFVGPTHKKRIKKWHLCIDAFGQMPVWSLQHPKKEAMDSFMLPEWKKKDFMRIFHEIAPQGWWCEMYVTGEIEWGYILHKNGKPMNEIEGETDKDYFRLVVNMEVEEILILQNLEEGEPNGYGQRGGYLFPTKEEVRKRIAEEKKNEDKP